MEITPIKIDTMARLHNCGVFFHDLFRFVIIFYDDTL